MSGAAFILVTNLFVAGLFCASFVLIAAYSGYRSARWFAAAYALGIVYLCLEFALPSLNDARTTAFLGGTTFAVTLLLLNVGLARRYDLESPRMLLTAVLAVSLVNYVAIQELPRGSMLRMTLYQLPYFAMQAIGAWTVLRAPKRRLADNVLAGFLGLSALHFLTKPLVAIAVGGPGASPQDYLATTYAMISQSMGVVLSVATALLLLAMLIVDVLSDITRRSEIDSLSGLFNRRGFEDRLAELAGAKSRNGLPLSVVLCDLDHFKAVNDTFGHAAGDMLIGRFAETLRAAAAPHHVVARIGGEEFAVILPGSNVSAARLFAEHVRAAYAERAAEGFEAEASFSASFGAAEMATGEQPAQVMLRADGALYAAKRAGRNCVRISPTLEAVRPGPQSAAS